MSGVVDALMVGIVVPAGTAAGADTTAIQALSKAQLKSIFECTLGTVAAPIDDHIDDVPTSVAQAEAPKAEASAEGASRAQDILAMIRNRQKQ
jgi:hypothetical protein